MSLPIAPPFAPMEAQLTGRLPSGGNWLYEPKWDGFRCLTFRDGEHIELQSKAGRPLGRYFPELVQRLSAIQVRRFVLDGEIVVPVEGLFSFDDLLQRIHPAQSRINRLARERPADLIVFDLLVDSGGRSLVSTPLAERRAALERFAADHLGTGGIALSPASRDEAHGRAWLTSDDLHLDGVVAKRLDCEYRSGDRTGMFKIKRRRTADCVVGGFRYSAGSASLPERQREIGSLLLGLYDADGLLHHVGFCSGLSAEERRDLTGRLQPLIRPPGFTGRAPGGPSRWRSAEATVWQPLSPRLVVEVQWDHFTGGRFRHGTKLLRWRPDKPPAQCTMDQIRANQPVAG